MQRYLENNIYFLEVQFHYEGGLSKSCYLELLLFIFTRSKNQHWGPFHVISVWWLNCQRRQFVSLIFFYFCFFVVCIFIFLSLYVCFCLSFSFLFYRYSPLITSIKSKEWGGGHRLILSDEYQSLVFSNKLEESGRAEADFFGISIFNLLHWILHFGKLHWPPWPIVQCMSKAKLTAVWKEKRNISQVNKTVN